jgi:nitroreductase
MIDDLIKGNRSFRRFDQSVTVERKTLEELIDLARQCASARNLQPLKYILSSDPKTNALIFDTLTWAVDLKDWHDPAEGERPAAYIVVLEDTTIALNFGCDHGIASQSIMLGARDRGLGGVMMASINKPQLHQALDIPQRFEILLVLALGQPAETVVIEPVASDGKLKYWRDSNGIHHVPKRSLDEIILG